MSETGIKKDSHTVLENISIQQLALDLDFE